MKSLPALSLACVLALVACQAREAPADTASQAGATASAPDLDTPEGKIQDAMSAAPAAVAQGATIMDWPATEDGDMTQLRAGTNGWTCFPTTPTTRAAGHRDPMCADSASMVWAQAWMSHTAPSVSTVGFVYMLQGDGGSSNTDPYATAPTADNQWVVTGPHVMVFPTDTADLAGITTDPSGGGPYVMWKGTPYAHVMVPVRK